MKRARVAYCGALHDATLEDGVLTLENGKIVRDEEVIWLPPIEPKTVIALGLNYASHAKELQFTEPESPLLFFKGVNTLIGHLAETKRPREVTFMHFECELAVVIGKRAKNVKKEEAYEYVEGYTIANDYAIRDYLENYYRPNLRVKNRDGCTPIGPFIVERDDIKDPMNLYLKTYVNDELVQVGNTRDMLFDIADIIEYISSFMTLERGDIILTGTPEGVIDVPVGSVVVTEIEGIGRLTSKIVAGD